MDSTASMSMLLDQSCRRDLSDEQQTNPRRERF